MHSGTMPVNDYVAERLCELREEAYCRVLKCFVASQTYDLVRSLIAVLMALFCVR